MLGMMNAPSEGVDFYAVRQTRKMSDPETSDLSEFSEMKQKDKVSYTSDGRKLINGKPVTMEEPANLWGNMLLRGRMRVSLPTTPNNEPADKQDSETEAEAESGVVAKNEKIEITEVPVLAASKNK
ncbi:unnamed protein product [Caenorhabditis angaria]|uniref:Uncharacterized protein n=1 Tax=Caenorhabditis angaria TaxID=860376 RepID=A0A9P1IE10_9PELO|nr:unnamed protein product [Caenorhabditis angaria]